MRLEAREDSPESFYQTKDMKITPITDSTKLDHRRADLIAYQGKSSFSRVQGNTEYVRLIKGPMNLYYQYSYYTTTSYDRPTSLNPSGFSTHNNTRVTRYFDLGLQEPLVLFSRENLGKSTMGCQSCQDVLKLYDQKRKSLKLWKYTNWAAIAGSLVIVFTTPNDVIEPSDLQVYGFATLFFGGLASEIYRLTRVSKNEIRLEEAVKKYNQFRLQ